MMSCRNRPVSAQICTPSCTRWTSINTGETLKIYHDPTNWVPGTYADVTATDPVVYLEQAMQTWNNAYDCGNLFELTDDPALANVIVSYVPPQPEGPLGTVLCACDAEDEVCVVQADHSLAFANTPQPMDMYQITTLVDTITEIRYTNTYLHELGHVLGMGHVSNQPFFSVMGQNPTRFEVVQLYPFDEQQLNERYPCGCTMVTPYVNINTSLPTNSHNTGEHCPGCQAP